MFFHNWSCTHLLCEGSAVFNPPNSWILLGPESRLTRLQRHAQIQRPALDLLEGPHQKEIQRPPLLKKSSSKRQNHPKSKLLKFVLQIFLGHNTITIRIQRLESLRFDAFIATVQTKFLRVTQFPIGESWRNGTTIEARQLGLRKTE